MAGTVKTNIVQLGDSATATQNLTIRTNVDGTFTIARGNAGATTQDILTINAAGEIAYPSMGAFTSYTPTVSAQSGTITTLGSVSGRYKQMGKLLLVSLNVAITTNGTASGGLVVSLPPGMTAASTQVLSGREISVTGNMLQAVTTIGQNTVAVFTYNNTWPGGNGYNTILSGAIEIQ